MAIPATAQQLEIHYINVGWGGSVLVKGPTGTTVLMEAGNTGKGTAYVVPYLQSIGLVPSTGLDYTIAGHQHCDHIGGLDEVVNAGYNVHIKNYYNGSSYASSCVDEWNAKAPTTTAGALVVPTVGQQIALGNGATLTFVAVNGRIIGGGTVSVSDENDRSIAVLIKYGGFDYLWASDLGGGTIDEACTGRFTSSQVDVETSVITAISPGGAFPLISAGGIDLLHVNHHGSESSTNMNYINKAQPAVAIIGVGDGESSGWDLPRIDVVEHVLMAQAAACITAPPAFVLQTEEGNPAGTLTSFAGFNVGDIKVTTDGLNSFTVSADGNVHQGVNELGVSGLPRMFALDDISTPDTTPPVTAVSAPATGATVSATTTVTATASDDRAVTNVEFYLDNVLQFTDTAGPYSWVWNTTTTANGAHMLTTKAYDAAGNVGTSAIVDVTVNNVADATPPTAPGNLSATSSAKRKIALSWTASSDNVGVAGYQVWRSSSPTGTFTQIATTTALTYTNSGLTSGSTWYYRVTATDAAGNVSAASNTASATVR
jgi:beta-lactamase superfamily II metal-dependent hydrolase